MINYVTYRKFVNLKNGQRVMFRFLNAQDRENLLKLFQDAPDEDIRFLKQDVKDSKLIRLLDRQYRLSESFTFGSSEHGEQCAHRRCHAPSRQTRH